jgi:hypothetical protein
VLLSRAREIKSQAFSVTAQPNLDRRAIIKALGDSAILSLKCLSRPSNDFSAPLAQRIKIAIKAARSSGAAQRSKSCCSKVIRCHLSLKVSKIVANEPRRVAGSPEHFFNAIEASL